MAIFHSIHRVLRAEKELKSAGVEFLLIPVPRQLTSDCGLALRYARQDEEGVEKILADTGLTPAERYRRAGEDYIRLEG